MSAGGLILLRTHFVDERVAQLARTYEAGGDYDVAIAVDETAGEVDVQGLPKLAMSLNSCARLGLQVAFEKPLWRCGDYAFYHALDLPRRYRRYWSIEYDIALNFADPLDFLRLIDREAREDYLTTFLEVGKPDWEWRRAAARRFPVVYSSGFALVRLSGEAIERLLARRRFEARRLAEANRPLDRNWLNDEAFVSSAAWEMGLSMADFNAYGDFYTPYTLMRGGVWRPSQLPAPDGRIYHAVRTGASYLAAVKSYYDFDLEAFFSGPEAELPQFAEAAVEYLFKRLARAPDDPRFVFGERLAGLASHLAKPIVAEALLRALARRRLRLCLEAVQFGRLPLELSGARSFDNVALGRPAWQSSTSARSRKRGLRREAEGGNNGAPEADYGFQTAQEDGPWWAVDLGQPLAVRGLRLHNRRDAERKLRLFLIETSADGLDWTPVYAHDGDPALLAMRPIEIRLVSPVTARYLRIRLPRRGVLHLVEVEIFRA